jgi:hypothetical protein
MKLMYSYIGAQLRSALWYISPLFIHDHREAEVIVSLHLAHEIP